MDKKKLCYLLGDESEKSLLSLEDPCFIFEEYARDSESDYILVEGDKLEELSRGKRIGDE